jgi:glutamate/aspartate transport system substrate-binding protein
VALPATAQQELTGVLKKVKETGKVTVGYAESWFPLSYLDRSKNPIGYSIDVCNKVVDAVKADLKQPGLKVEMKPIKVEDATSYIVSGVIDIHCGPVLNTWAAKGRVDFGLTYFVKRYRFASHEWAHMNEGSDMENKSFSTIYGESMSALQALDTAQNYKAKIIPYRSIDEAFSVFRDDAVQAVFLDEISLAQGVAKSPSTDPAMVRMSDAAFGAEPYSLVFAKNDAPFKRVLLGAMRQLYSSGGIQSIYGKWFNSPIPPGGINLGLPVNETLGKVFEHPTDSPDPALYQSQ